MKQQNLRYFRERIKEIYFHKSSELRKSLVVKAKKCTERQKIELIRKGKVKLFSEANIDYPYYTKEFTLSDAFDFSKYCQDETIDFAYEKRNNSLKIEYDKIRDSAILGDEAEALQLLKDFIEQKF